VPGKRGKQFKKKGFKQEISRSFSRETIWISEKKRGEKELRNRSMTKPMEPAVNTTRKGRRGIAEGEESGKKMLRAKIDCFVLASGSRRGTASKADQKDANPQRA